MIERREFSRPPEAVRLTWCEWLRHHTIDPCDVAICGFIERDTEARQIRYLAYSKDRNGKYLYDWEADRSVMDVCVVQLESVLSPFPESCSLDRGAEGSSRYIHPQDL